jgi:pyruvate-formate lyase-activating enzyme
MRTYTNELPFLNTIGFMLTYKCPISCPHCIAECGPHRKEEMSLIDCMYWIDEARAYKGTNIQGLALTGGEPFYNTEKLAHISYFARKRNFVVSVVTNAFWATTRSRALRILQDLPSIQMISISTDVYHQQFIPFTYIANAIWAAKQTHKLFLISVCTENLNDQDYLRILDDLRDIGVENRVRTVIAYPAGRGKNLQGDGRYESAKDPMKVACSTASSPIVFPDGKVCACIGPVLTLKEKHPLVLGDLRKQSMQNILNNAEMNPILQVIRIWGPGKLISLFEKYGYGDRLPETFLANTACDICYKLMSQPDLVKILQNIIEKDDELRLEIAYARVYYLEETKMVEEYCLV